LIRHPAQNRAITPGESIPEDETRAHAHTNRGWRNRYRVPPYALYWPKPEALDGTWNLPPLQRVK